jgi:hypothetical protein
MFIYTKRFCLVFLLLSVSLFTQAQSFSLQEGDLIFQESCSGNLSKAIKEVTTGIKGYNFTHVGIVFKKNNDFFVLEATRPNVCITPLSSYLYPDNDNNCYPKSVVGRLKDKYKNLIPKALEEGMQHIGKEYDSEFCLNNNKYYCSELIYDIFYRANNNKAVFKLNKMTFKSKDTGSFSPEWVSHFSKLGIEIPEGDFGINPGAMSQSKVINIVHTY